VGETGGDVKPKNISASLQDKYERGYRWYVIWSEGWLDKDKFVTAFVQYRTARGFANRAREKGYYAHGPEMIEKVNSDAE
jgi:hypothetical protein